MESPMKALTIAALAASALVTLAAPSLGAAQPYDHRDWGHGPGDYGPPRDHPGAWDLDQRIDWLQHRIDHGRDDGSLDRREAYRVQTQLDDIRHTEHRIIRNEGRLGHRDRDMLNDRLDRLNDQIRWLRHNDERRPW
jgi:hypothetical protein